MGVAMKPEEGLQVFAGDAFTRIVHAPVAAFASDAHAVDANDEVGSDALVIEGRGGGERMNRG